MNICRDGEEKSANAFTHARKTALHTQLCHEGDREAHLWKVGEKRFFSSFTLEPPFFTAFAALAALALASSAAQRDAGSGKETIALDFSFLGLLGAPEKRVAGVSDAATRARLGRGGLVGRTPGRKLTLSHLAGTTT